MISSGLLGIGGKNHDLGKESRFMTQGQRKENVSLNENEQSKNVNEIDEHGHVNVAANDLTKKLKNEFFLSNQLILTNAHVIADQKFVMVRKFGSPERFTARVLAVGHECDLALLSVDDQAFFDNCRSLELGELPV